jgi:hypothetical protein
VFGLEEAGNNRRMEKAAEWRGFITYVHHRLSSQRELDGRDIMGHIQTAWEMQTEFWVGNRKRKRQIWRHRRNWDVLLNQTN